jgi:hypothetical protein
MAQANNEMLEDALKQDTTGRAKTVGWRRSTGPSSDETLGEGSPASANGVGGFFSFKRASGTATGTNTPVLGSRGSSPPAPRGVATHHVASASMPSLVADPAIKQVEELTSALEKERDAAKKAREEKAAVEAELENLSQALFEEVRVNYLDTFSRHSPQRCAGKQNGRDGTYQGC